MMDSRIAGDVTEAADIVFSKYALPRNDLTHLHRNTSLDVNMLPKQRARSVTWHGCAIRPASSEETIAKELTGTWQVEQLFVLQQALVLFDALRRMRCLATAMPPTFGLRLGRYHQVTHA
jgi:hypothetical protein